MRVLVTGGAGFIGSHLVSALLSAGDDVTVIDNFEEDYPRAVKERAITRHRGHSRWRFIEQDIRLGLDDRVPGTFDVLVHLAAKAGVLPSIADPIGTYATNVCGTLAVFEFARARSIPRVVFASSSSVYGGNPHVPWCETDLMQPISPYAATKLAGEQIASVYSHLYGIQAVALI